jgi:hypothetical protein
MSTQAYADHSLDALMALIKHDDTMCMVGVSPSPQQIAAFERMLKCNVNDRFEIDMASLNGA